MKNIAKALLDVQKGLDPVHKGKQGYGYKYADLPSVMEACLESLNKAGVLVIQSPERTDKAAACVVTRLIHAESGEEIYGTIEVPHGEIAKMSVAQAYGSAMTYARRYALVSMLGIVTEDDDGAMAGKKVARETKPTVSAEKKESMAVDAAQGLVTMMPNEIELRGMYLKENAEIIERCSKYPRALEILDGAGLV